MERIRRFMANSSKRKRILIYVSIAVGALIILLLLVLLIWWLFRSTHKLPEPWRHFIIDYEHDTFVMDGEPFHFVSGEFHYFRAPHQRWRNILQKMRSAGLNCVSTYVEWSSHETSKGKFDFNGDNDIVQFITTAFEEDLYVILRPGPYINADRDFGGLPPWLLTDYSGIQIRTMNRYFVLSVENWFDELFPRLQDHLYGYGGPVIMVQVENEYGSLNKCDEGYKIWLRDLFKSHVGDAAVLYTTDKDEKSLKCGSIPDVYATINFGPDDDAEVKFAEMRNHSAHGPLFNSQLYTGYPCYWREPMKIMDTAVIKKATLDLLTRNANFNYYMFFGGTNFYFRNGANILTDKDGNKVYRAICTSYDYDAPLDEAGDYTKKYWDILDALSTRGNPLPDDFKPKAARKKGNYGTVPLKVAGELFYNIHHITDRIESYSYLPTKFEDMGLKYGYALYINEIPSVKYLPNALDSITLSDSFADKCFTYTNDEQQGHLVLGKGIRLRGETTNVNKTVEILQGDLLRILIENQGRISSGDMDDPKGLFEAPMHRQKLLTRWSMTALPFEDISWLRTMGPYSNTFVNVPFFYQGELVLPKQAMPLDTYIDFSGWFEGSVFINNCSLGRFWANVGPQVTIFVPRSCFLVHPKKNWIVIFVPYEYPLQGGPQQTITFTDKPNLGKPN